jgi:aminomethyltransferase
MTTLQKTFFYEKHVGLNAKISPFGGFLMPIQYEGIIKEHTATRTHATIFDTCHMGEFMLKGSNVIADLEKIVTCPVATMKIGQCRYGFICNENGGVIDDQILYRLGVNEFLMVVNASTEPADFVWVKGNLSPSTEIQNITSTTAKLDLQGPASPKIFQKFMADPINDMKYYHFKYNTFRGEKILTSRTGYTGEIGFEIYCSPELAFKFWDDCLNEGVVPAGLGARDTLRLEMGYPLYGHELDQDTNAAESGFSKAIGDKPCIGSGALKDPSKNRKLLCGITLEGKRAARHGDKILDRSGNETGHITSGSFSPSLQNAIALGYVNKEQATDGTQLIIKTERNELKGVVTQLPFYNEATGRGNIENFL